MVGLAGVDWDAEVFSDAATILDAGEGLADYLRWSFWISALGGYLLLVPFALLLFSLFRSGHEFSAMVFTVGGVVYLLMGAAGSAIFAIAWPTLVQDYAAATVGEQSGIVREFELVEMIAGGGFHGVVQNLAGALWLVGIGTLMRPRLRGLGVLAMVIGAFLVLNSVGNLAGLEALSTMGVLGNVILLPAWAILVGLRLIADGEPRADVSPSS